jgi:5-hydroxyisourate hydrolase
VFLIAASGRTADEILDSLRLRVANEPSTQLALAAGELRKIARLRLERLVRGSGLQMSISTHVLDTMRGTAAAGIEVTLSRREPDGDWKSVGEAVTDADGRIRALTDEELEAGEYRLEFATAPYFERSGLSAFYPLVSIVFSLEDATGHVHVPLLLSPYGYTTYRGS